MFFWYVITGLVEAVTDLYLSVLVNIVVQSEYFFITSYSDFPSFVLDMANVWESELGTELLKELDLSCGGGSFFCRERVQKLFR
jgi:hypothetical protein